MALTLHESDQFFKEKGATKFMDYHTRSGPTYAPRFVHMFRHYFLPDMREIGYITPALMDCDIYKPQVFEEPRVWDASFITEPVKEIL